MKTYGLKYNKHKHIDNHLPKGYINWWEDEFKSVSKKRERNKIKLKLKKMKFYNYK